MHHVHLQLQATVLSAASSAASSEVQLQLQPEVQLQLEPRRRPLQRRLQLQQAASLATSLLVYAQRPALDAPPQLCSGLWQIRASASNVLLESARSSAPTS